MLGLGKDIGGHPFDLLMELETSQIQLDCAALHLARDAYPSISVPRYLNVIDSLARQVGTLRPGLAANLRYEAMQTVLVQYHRLTGSDETYYHPDNVYLNRVLDTGRGLPISLSIVWLSVARRLNWPVFGVALPGHFIVRFEDAERFILVDPFNDGCTLSIADCRKLVHRGFEGKLPFSENHLRAVDARAVLLRLLKTLRNIYLTRNELPPLVRVLRHMTALEPANGRYLQDLAAACCRQGDVRAAAAHLELYLHRLPNADDSHVVRTNLRQLRAALVARN